MSNSRFAGLVEDIRDEKNENKYEKKIKQFKEKEDEFPTLTVVNKKVHAKKEPSQLDYSKLKGIMDPVTNKEPSFGEGWVVYKRDPITRNTIIYPSKSNSNSDNINDTQEKGSKRLVELYEKRTNQFIEINGYDTWEKMFKYPGWQEYEAESEEEDDTSESGEEKDGIEEMVLIDYEYK